MFTPFSFLSTLVGVGLAGVSTDTSFVSVTLSLVNTVALLVIFWASPLALTTKSMIGVWVCLDLSLLYRPNKYESSVKVKSWPFLSSL